MFIAEVDLRWTTLNPVAASYPHATPHVPEQRSPIRGDPIPSLLLLFRVVGRARVDASKINFAPSGLVFHHVLVFTPVYLALQSRVNEQPFLNLNSLCAVKCTLESHSLFL